MSLLTLALVLIGLVVLAVVGWLMLPLPEPPPPEEDLAAPYRQALHASMRMQTAAQDLERQLCAEAIRRAEGEPGGES